MKKVIAAINITLDGYCDHTAGIADEELHFHYAELLNKAGIILYGRKTYELMTYWQDLVKNPVDDKAMNDFARMMDIVPKLVFSKTLKTLDWDSARLAERSLEEEITELKKLPGKDIMIGSPSLIAQATQLNLVDEYQLCIHPVILGDGLLLFRDMPVNRMLKLTQSKTLGSGAIVLYYITGE